MSEDVEEAAPPRCAYFHYVRSVEVSGEGDLLLHHHGNVETYVMQESAIGPGDRIETLIPVWAEQAKKRQIEPVGWAFADVRWRRRSYLVVVLDAPGFRFASEGALLITGRSAKKFGPSALMNLVVDGTPMQAIYCLNHFKKEDGSPPDEKGELFKPLSLEFTSTASDMLRTFTHDDSGTNMGPERP